MDADHGCAFPDEACSTCEQSLDGFRITDCGPVPPPPCCHTPHLCGGPHPDCYDALRAEADTFQVERDADGKAVNLVPLVEIRLPVAKPLYSGPHGDYTAHAVGECVDCTPVHLCPGCKLYGHDGCGLHGNRGSANDGAEHLRQRCRCRSGTADECDRHRR